MKQTNFFKKTLLLAALVAGVSTAWAESETLPNASNFHLSYAAYTNLQSGSGYEGTYPNENTTNIKRSGTATFTLNNNTEQKYTITFDATTRYDVVKPQVNLKITNNDGSVTYCDKTVTLNDLTGNWSTYNNSLSCVTTTVLPVASDLKFIMTFNSESTYCCNIKNLKFTAFSGDLHTLTASTENGTVTGGGSFANGETVTLSATNTTWGYAFSKWTTNEDVEISTKNPYSYTMGNADVTVKGVFADDPSIKQSIPTAVDTYLDVDKANMEHAGNGKYKTWDTYKGFDDFRAQGYVQFALTSTIAQKYTVSFMAGRDATDAAKMRFQFAKKATPETIEFEKDVDVIFQESEKTWTPSKLFSITTDEMAAGDWIMTMIFRPGESTSYTTCNINRIAFTAVAVDVALDESTNYTPAAKYANVTLTRSISADKWSTIILPFDLTAAQVTSTFGENAKVAQFTGKDATSVTMSTTTTMNANEPYMIKVTGSEYTSPVAINGVTIETGDKFKRLDDFTFQGVYESGKIPSGAYYVKNNQLYTANGNQNIKPFRAYFTSEVGSAHGLTLIIDDGGETTTIALLKADGTMETIAEGKVFDLQGRHVAQPTKGMYIVNGKKVIIK